MNYCYSHIHLHFLFLDLSCTYVCSTLCPVHVVFYHLQASTCSSLPSGKQAIVKTQTTCTWWKEMLSLWLHMPMTGRRTQPWHSQGEPCSFLPQQARSIKKRHLSANNSRIGRGTCKQNELTWKNEDTDHCSCLSWKNKYSCVTAYRHWMHLYIGGSWLPCLYSGKKKLNPLISVHHSVNIYHNWFICLYWIPWCSQHEALC